MGESCNAPVLSRYFIESFYLFRVGMILVNCFHLVNMLYLSMFTFCRDLGAFARKLSEGYFGPLVVKIYHIGFFLS